MYLTAQPDPVDPGDVLTICVEDVPLSVTTIEVSIDCSAPVDPALHTLVMTRADNTSSICSTWNVPEDFTGAWIDADGCDRIRVSAA